MLFLLRGLGTYQLVHISYQAAQQLAAHRYHPIIIQILHYIYQKNPHNIHEQRNSYLLNHSLLYCLPGRNLFSQFVGSQHIAYYPKSSETSSWSVCTHHYWWRALPPLVKCTRACHFRWACPSRMLSHSCPRTGFLKQHTHTHTHVQ